MSCTATHDSAKQHRDGCGSRKFLVTQKCTAGYCATPRMLLRWASWRALCCCMLALLPACAADTTGNEAQVCVRLHHCLKLCAQLSVLLVTPCPVAPGGCVSVFRAHQQLGGSGTSRGARAAGRQRRYRRVGRTTANSAHVLAHRRCARPGRGSTTATWQIRCPCTAPSSDWASQTPTSSSCWQTTWRARHAAPAAHVAAAPDCARVHVRTPPSGVQPSQPVSRRGVQRRAARAGLVRASAVREPPHRTCGHHPHGAAARALTSPRRYGQNVEVDYRGYDVTVENFLRVLTGTHGPAAAAAAVVVAVVLSLCHAPTSDGRSRRACPPLPPACLPVAAQVATMTGCLAASVC